MLLTSKVLRVMTAEQIADAAIASREDFVAFETLKSELVRKVWLSRGCGQAGAERRARELLAARAYVT